ncbi:hypothetical protein A2U01_0109975, partial [Trifolium medium]|nr:hypothetical protein [Trifolium medium]
RPLRVAQLGVARCAALGCCDCLFPVTCATRRAIPRGAQ